MGIAKRLTLFGDKNIESPYCCPYLKNRKFKKPYTALADDNSLMPSDTLQAPNSLENDIADKSALNTLKMNYGALWSVTQPQGRAKDSNFDYNATPEEVEDYLKTVYEENGLSY